MSRFMLGAGAALALTLASAAQAQPPAPRAEPTPPRGGPPLALALEAVQTAVSACEAKGYKVSAVIEDYHGSPIALLSGDGASYKTADLVRLKASTVMRYKVPSGEIMKRTLTDPALAAEVKADPNIGAAHQGGLPVMAGGKFIGAIAVSGSPGGEKDEACAQAGLDKIASRLQ